ncbi:hypothetical protein [Ferrimicrobium sp.]|uniref:hypothetical protein n=1 Tax=Ferrimicrobium sp. TaxID=2926050 RepID=UPI002619580E|nr:hypothetical protein [Ferrimicrobium sp.]
MSWRVFKGSIALGLSFAVATSLTLFATESTSYATTPTIAQAEGTVDGAPYEVQVPPNFNGTLLLYSHGYVFDGAKNPTPIDASDPISQGILLSQGYALAGSSYSQQGWAVKAALTDQIATLNVAKAYVSSHSTTPISSVIPWGVSMGGDVTAGLVQQNIGTFSGAMIACGVDGGAVPIWNQQLTALFAFKELIDPSLQIVDLSSPTAAETQLLAALEALNTAATTPAGQARLSLVAALGDIPGWFWNGSITHKPGDTAAGIATQLTDQIEWLATTDLPFSFLGREDLEAKAGGNPSWTTGVQYASVLKKSIDAKEVEALYSAIPSYAGVSLAGDLATLQDATQISADPAAVTYLQNAIDINGETGDIPILTMHTIGDGLVSPQNETAYKDALDAAGNGNNLAQVYVNNAGHCEFNPAELVAGIDTVHARIVAGSWNPTPRSLNTLANAIIAKVSTAADVSVTKYDLADPLKDTSALEPHAPDFVSYQPGVPLRPYQQGYTTTSSRGQLSYHAAPPRGSLAPGTSTAPIIGIAATPAGNGYWLVNAHGQVFTRGSAKFYGQVAATMPNPGHPGSPLMPGAPMPPASIVGIAATPGGHGYWLVSSTGKVYNFGSAKFYGQVAATMPNPGHPGSPLMPGAPMPPASIVGIAATPYGAGYWVFGANGAVYSFGGAPTYPAMATSPGPSTTPVTAATIG